MSKLITVIMIMVLIIASLAIVQAADPGPNIEQKAVKTVPPVYPPIAKRKRVEGKVIVGLQVNADGTVANAEFLEGNALFKPASLDAAKQWVFQKSSGGTSGHIVFKFQLEGE